MNKINETPVLTEKKLKEKKVIDFCKWTVSIVFSMFAIIGLFSGAIISCLCLVLASLIVLPPVTKFLREKYKFHIHASIKVVGLIVLIIFSVINIPPENNIQKVILVSVGQNGYLGSGQPQVLVATTKENENAIVKAAVANDNIGMADVVANGGGFFVQNGTKVLVIDSTFSLRQVRILDGDSAGRSGWVPVEFVKKMN